MDSSVRAMKRVRMDSKLSTFSATAWVRCASVAMGPGSLQGKPQNLDVATLDSSVRRGATGSLSAGHRNLRDRAAVSTRMTKQNCSPTTDAIRCWVSASRKFGGRPADDPVPSDHIRFQERSADFVFGQPARRGRRRPRGPGSAGAQKADFVFGQPAHDHVLAAVPVEHPAQIGAGETLRVAVAPAAATMMRRSRNSRAFPRSAPGTAAPAPDSPRRESSSTGRRALPRPLTAACRGARP